MTVDQVILQTIMSEGQIAESKLSERYRKLCSKYNIASPPDFEEEIVHINVILDQIGFNFRKLRNELENGEWWYFLVNREGGSSLSNQAALYLKDVIRTIFATGRGEGLPLDVAPRNLYDKVNNQEYIRMLCVQGWLVSKDDRIFVSPRSMLELEPWIQENFEGQTLFKCIGCGQWLMKGRCCMNSECNARLHDHCYDAYFELRNGEQGICPKCGDRI